MNKVETEKIMNWLNMSRWYRLVTWSGGSKAGSAYDDMGTRREQWIVASDTYLYQCRDYAMDDWGPLYFDATNEEVSSVDDIVGALIEDYGFDALDPNVLIHPKLRGFVENRVRAKIR